MNRTIRFSVLTVSDRCSRGQAEDTAGPAVIERVSQTLSAQLVLHACVPDDRDAIARLLREWSHPDARTDLVLTVGGTGLSPRDVTPEATLAVLERRCPGLTELMRYRCYPSGPLVFLSRAEAGTLDQTLIVNLPGSRRGATESLAAILEVLPHALSLLRGDSSSHDAT
jgi:molybdenum cofactor synthesis domain-containing protein